MSVAELVDRARDLDHVRERRALGVEIEDAPVRPLERGDAARPHVQRYRAHVRDIDERLDVVEHEVADLALGLLAPHRLEPEPLRRVDRRVFLEERLAVDAVGKAREHDRAVAQVRQQPVRDAAVVLDHVALGVAVGGPEHLVEVREIDRAWRARGRQLRPARPARRPRARVSASDSATPGQTHCAADLSSRTRMNVGWRSDPSGVRCLNFTCTTGPGASQTAPRSSGAAAGGSARSSASSFGSIALKSRAPKPPPTRPAYASSAVAVLSEQQRAESVSAVLRGQEPHDDEVVGFRGVDLDPILRALAHIRRRGALADDALEPEPLGLDEHRLAVLGDVLGVAQRPDRRQQRTQRVLALDERQRAQVEIFEGEQIERVERARQLERRALGVRAPRETAALLEQREAWDAARVVDDHLAVDDEPLDTATRRRSPRRPETLR